MDANNLRRMNEIVDIAFAKWRAEPFNRQKQAEYEKQKLALDELVAAEVRATMQKD